MKKIILLAFFITNNIFIFAQNTAKDSISATINRFFEGMKKHDSTMIRSTLSPFVVFQTIKKSANGGISISTESINDFLSVIAKPSTDIFDEKIVFEHISNDELLASVWTPYRFYVNEKFSHCGNNSFQLVKINNDWKIQYIIDTRKRKGCIE